MYKNKVYAWIVCQADPTTIKNWRELVNVWETGELWVDVLDASFLNSDGVAVHHGYCSFTGTVYTVNML